MNADTELVIVLGVACLTEDRAVEEQRAMLTVALRIDRARGRFTVTNPDPVPPTLVALVRDTYKPGMGRSVELTKAQERKYQTLLVSWQKCETCGAPRGAHGLDTHPYDTDGEP